MSDDSDDEVGYKNAPKHGQFPPKTSGNPKGRPRGKKSGTKTLRALLEAPTTVKTSAGQQTLSRFEVMLRVAMLKGMGGDRSAQRNIDLLKEKCGLSSPDPEPQEGGVLHLSHDAATALQQLREKGVSEEEAAQRIKNFES